MTLCSVSYVPSLSRRRLQLLIAKRGSGDEVNVDFELTEGVFSRAVLRDTATVSLWLGANVMLEYSLDEVRTAQPARSGKRGRARQSGRGAQILLNELR